MTSWARVRRRQHQHGCGGYRRAASASRRDGRRPGRAVFSRRQGRQPGGRGAKLGAPTTLIGRLGRDAFGDDLKSFSRRAGRRPQLRARNAQAHTGTAIITVANADNTIVVIPGANGLVRPADVAAVALAAETSRSASSKFRNPRSTPSSARARRRGQQPSSIPRPRWRLTAKCSISWTS